MDPVSNRARSQEFLEEQRADTASPELEPKPLISSKKERERKKPTYFLLNLQILNIQHITNAQLRAPTPRAASRATIHEPRTHITVLVEQRNREFVQLLAFLVHYLKKVASHLEPQATLDLEAVHGGEFAQGWVRQCAVEVVHHLRVLVVLFSKKICSAFGEVEVNNHFKQRFGDGGVVEKMGGVESSKNVSSTSLSIERP